MAEHESPEMICALSEAPANGDGAISGSHLLRSYAATYAPSLRSLSWTETVFASAKSRACTDHSPYCWRQPGEHLADRLDQCNVNATERTGRRLHPTFGRGFRRGFTCQRRHAAVLKSCSNQNVQTTKNSLVDWGPLCSIPGALLALYVFARI